jgi:hypothetical protein
MILVIMLFGLHYYSSIQIFQNFSFLFEIKKISRVFMRDNIIIFHISLQTKWNYLE